MTHTYKFKLVCRCPNDKSVNIYDVEIKSDDVIEVEQFQKVQTRIYNEFYFQEEVFDLLKAAYDNVQVVGYHLGVKVISE
jgi:hypothetical protein